MGWPEERTKLAAYLTANGPSASSTSSSTFGKGLIASGRTDDDGVCMVLDDNEFSLRSVRLARGDTIYIELTDLK
jgi:hypothetical protein